MIEISALGLALHVVRKFAPGEKRLKVRTGKIFENLDPDQGEACKIVLNPRAAMKFTVGFPCVFVLSAGPNALPAQATLVIVRDWPGSSMPSFT